MADVTVLMTDIVGSSVISTRLGGENYRDRFLKGYNETVLQEIAIHHGSEYQAQVDPGDDCKKAYFTSPIDAVACAVAIENKLKQYGFSIDSDDNQEKVSIHLALHTCPALSGGKPDPAQMAIAARILKLSDAEQILISQDCHAAYTAV